MVRTSQPNEHELLLEYGAIMLVMEIAGTAFVGQRFCLQQRIVTTK